jgi:phytol kinase
LTSDLLIAAGVIIFVLGGIQAANVVYDRGVPNFVSRKIGHGAGGFAFLSALIVRPWTAMSIAAIFTVLLVCAHLLLPIFIRGIGGSGRSGGSLAEVWFPMVALPVFAVSWLWLKQPLPAVASLLFMAWGDGVTGLVRSRFYKQPVKGIWGSLAMLAVCLAVSWFMIKPFWIGVIASVAATAAERIFGDVGLVKKIDDNLAVPVISLSVILGLLALTGKL